MIYFSKSKGTHTLYPTLTYILKWWGYIGFLQEQSLGDEAHIHLILQILLKFNFFEHKPLFNLALPKQKRLDRAFRLISPLLLISTNISLITPLTKQNATHLTIIDIIP